MLIGPGEPSGNCSKLWKDNFMCVQRVGPNLQNSRAFYLQWKLLGGSMSIVNRMAKLLHLTPLQQNRLMPGGTFWILKLHVSHLDLSLIHLPSDTSHWTCMEPRRRESSATSSGCCTRALPLGMICRFSVTLKWYLSVR